MSTYISDAYKNKFRELGQEMADILTFFSLDLCGVICSYLAVGIAKKNVLPQKMFNFELDCSGWMFNMAIHPFDNSIWLTSNYGIRIFDQDGSFQRQIERSVAYRRIAIHPNGTIFVTGQREIQLLSCTGIFKKILNLDYYSGPILSDSEKGIYIQTSQEILKVDDQGNVLQTFCTKFQEVALFRTLLGINNDGRPIVKYMGENLLLDMDTCTKTTFPKFSADSVTVDAIGNIYCLKLNELTIKVLDPTGKDLTEFPSDHPTCICIDKRGFIYVRDNYGVQVLCFE